MDKIIIKMEENREITLIRNDEVFFSIPLEKRELKGSEIIKLLDYRLGKSYEIFIENPNSLDVKVVEEIHNIISELATNLMELQDTDFDYVPQTEVDETDSWVDEVEDDKIPF